MERKNRLFSNYKLIIAGVIIVALVVALILCVIPKERKLTALEEERLKENSKDVMLHMEEIDRGSEGTGADELKDISKDRFIAYALEYAYSTESKTELSVSDIKSIIESKFDIQVSEDDLNGVGISPILLDKHVNHEPINRIYSISKTGFTKRDIASIPVSNYILTSMKADGDDYIITYDKYTVKNPYDALNAATDNIPAINDYLNGNGKVAPVKAAITSDNAANIANKDKETTIKYSVKNGKITIVSIK